MRIYQTLEKSLWNSLTRKIVGNVVFLLMPYLLLLGIGGYYLWHLDADLAALRLAASESGPMAETLRQLRILGAISLPVAFLAGLAAVLFMRHLFLRPIRDITTVLRAIRDRDGDISGTLPTYTHDEISAMAASYNEFADRLRLIFAEARRHSVNVSLAAVRLCQVLTEADRAARDQEAQAHQVFQASEQASSAIAEISGHTLTISDQTNANLQDIRGSGEELRRVREQIQAIRGLADGFQETVRSLSDSSANIGKILTMVKGFSEQTNLLALNASIEAARAGEAGRGFAVVADEVRNLSRKISEAAGEIGQHIHSMKSLVDRTSAGATDILGHVERTETFIQETNAQFGRLVEDFNETSQQLTTISSALEELSCTNRETHGHVGRITELAEAMKADIDRSRQHSGDLELATQQTQELLSRFVIGFGGFEHITRTAMGWAREVTQALAALRAQGLNLFDERYRRVNPGQQPEKFMTDYTEAFERALRPLFDRFIRESPNFRYAIAVDHNGYAPAHHSHLSKPLTGDLAADLAQSRHRRFFVGNRAEKCRCSHERPFLLQTFIRDTGEVLNDLSIPLYVDGRHWGALIMGFEPSCLLDDAPRAGG